MSENKAKIKFNANNFEILEEGDFVNAVSSDGDRLGYILSYGKKYDKVEKRINKYESLIKFEYDN